MTRPTCPSSGQSGRAVALVTLERLLLPGRVAGVAGRDWLFCDSPDCDVVYFTEGDCDASGVSGVSGATRVRADLSVRVGVKERQAPRPLCYCFGHTAESIRAEFERTGTSTVLASVSEQMKAGACSCDVMNPSGNCCFGDLRREVALVLDSAAHSGAALAIDEGEQE